METGQGTLLPAQTSLTPQIKKQPTGGGSDSASNLVRFPPPVPPLSPCWAAQKLVVVIFQSNPYFLHFINGCFESLLIIYCPQNREGCVGWITNIKYQHWDAQTDRIKITTDIDKRSCSKQQKSIDDINQEKHCRSVISIKLFVVRSILV